MRTGRFGDVTSAVGQSIVINNLSFTVAGVSPRAFCSRSPAVPPVALPAIRGINSAAQRSG